MFWHFFIILYSVALNVNYVGGPGGPIFHPEKTFLLESIRIYILEFYAPFQIRKSFRFRSVVSSVATLRKIQNFYLKYFSNIPCKRCTIHILYIKLQNSTKQIKKVVWIVWIVNIKVIQLVKVLYTFLCQSTTSLYCTWHSLIDLDGRWVRTSYWKKMTENIEISVKQNFENNFVGLINKFGFKLKWIFFWWHLSYQNVLVLSSIAQQKLHTHYNLTRSDLTNVTNTLFTLTFN